MKGVILSSLVLLVGVSAVRAEELVREVSWSALKKEGKLLAGEVVQDEKPGVGEVLKVENTEASPKSINILDLEQPGIKTIHYAVNGRVRYEKVEKTQSQGVEQFGFLEMWSTFANGGMYFSRTLGDFGPFGRLEGTSDWRPFTLPFYSNANTGTPTRIVVNVVLPGRGTVYLSPLRIEQYQGFPAIFAPGAVTGGLAAAVIGGGMGTIVAVLLGLIAILASLGKARPVAIGLVIVLVLFGLGSLVLGLIVLGASLPAAVAIAFFAGGLAAAVLAAVSFLLVRRRYGQLELRKMAAMDVGAR
jgi:hypothetical protein